MIDLKLDKMWYVFFNFNLFFFIKRNDTLSDSITYDINQTNNFFIDRDKDKIMKIYGKTIIITR